LRIRFRIRIRIRIRISIRIRVRVTAEICTGLQRKLRYRSKLSRTCRG
jgi:hypothetical protein